MYRFFLKRIFDLFIALLVLILTSPLVLVTYIILKIVNNGDAFFFQQRPGLHGKPFFIVKFKTMRDARDKNGRLLPDKDRLTAVGKLVRKLSIDELPQLLNVMKGDMSLIGPRPLLMDYLPLYSDFQKRRNEVKPGITGWAQVNGRNSISWEQKFALDVWYVDNMSLAVDFNILIMTVLKVLKASDINSSNEVPMPRFTGNN
ncbi:sugar transferase [Desertivirga arenae]|uniref:sugar transferase n=1 Tax=Desertivirga arenae TaxID=2810309 RepID=UPI001A95853A|nr:sugar transferase [Pedobacter sp. SYSU D00823]